MSNGVNYVPNTLCNLCQLLISGEEHQKNHARVAMFASLQGFDFRQQHHSYFSLQKRAASGCHLCSILAASISSNLQDLRRAEDLLTAPGGHVLSNDEKREMQHRDFSIWACVQYDPMKTTRGPPELRLNSVAEDQGNIYLCSFQLFPAEKILETMRLPRRSTYSAGLVARIREQSQICLRDHPRCANNAMSRGSARQLPTRLLYVGDISTKKTARVMQSSDLNSATGYMTLSHKWGNVPVLQLTTENEEVLKKDFDTQELPKLFQDVGNLVSELGGQYVWIDTLCICQDNREEWLRETGLMSEIYSGSLLNIAASCSTHQESLYRERNPLPLLPCRFRIEWMPGEDFQKNVRIEYTDNIDLNLLGALPLQKRGWVLQERLLAPRVVHFGAEQVFWECGMGVSPELRSGSPSPRAHETIKFSFAKVMIEGSSNAYKPSSLWRELVRQYTGTSISHAGDKLIAISGIARYFHAMTKGELGSYYAGLWQANIEAQLLWSIDMAENKMRVSHRPTEYRAPSWSWASVDGTVSDVSLRAETHWSNKACLFRVLKVETSGLVDDYGPITAALLRVEGNLCELTLTRNEEVATQPHGGDIASQFTIRIGHVAFDHKRIAWDDNTPIALEQLPNKQLYMMPMRASNSERWHKVSQILPVEYWTESQRQTCYASHAGDAKTAQSIDSEEACVHFLSERNLVAVKAKNWPVGYHGRSGCDIQILGMVVEWTGERGRYKRVGMLDTWTGSEVEAVWRACYDGVADEKLFLEVDPDRASFVVEIV